MQLARSNPVLGKAVEALSVISADESNRRLYEARKKAQRDEYDAMLGARLEGEAKAAQQILDLLKGGISTQELQRRLESGSL